MVDLATIPELLELTACSNLVRIPDGIDVPMTARVRQIVDSAEFRRLAQIKQLGLVSQVYPAAHHSRFEHSLGVYRMALLFLQKLRARSSILDRHYIGMMPKCSSQRLYCTT